MECMTPLTIRHKRTGESMAVPCGKCPACGKNRVSQWSFRLLQEEKRSSSAHFLTLTYDTSRVPITRNGFMSLDKVDVQKFLKRLRFAQAKISDERIKYYLVGEYGGKTKRPHYHAILFNAQLPLIQPAWDMGSIHYGDVQGASVGYTLKYMSKPRWRPLHSNDDRAPQFGLMSKGLGENYVTDAMKEWHLSDPDNRMYCNLPDGKKSVCLDIIRAKSMIARCSTLSLKLGLSIPHLESA